MTGTQHPGRRAHGAGGADERGDYIPVGSRRSVPRGPRDPFLVRIGVLLAAGVLLAPVAAALKGDNTVTTGQETNTAIAVLNPIGVEAGGADDTSLDTRAETAPDSAADPGQATDRSADRRNRRGGSTPTAAPATTGAPTTSAPTTAAPQQSPVAQVGTTAPPACALDYTVQPGDSWIGIADRAEVQLRTLLVANGATVDTVLLPGDELCIPAGGRDPGPPPTAAPTTAAPTTAPPATSPPTTSAPTAPPMSWSQAQVVEIIRSVWPDHLEDRAIEIAQRESNLIPTARNYCCYGLFQMYWTVHRSWLTGLGVTSAEQLFDPRVNARAAYALYQRSGGWGPWALG